jgi:DNA-binding LytR/AlgR family response regulator
VRVHRSAIVALPEIVGLERDASGDGVLRLRSGARVPLGRSFRREFHARWQGAS